MKALIAAIALLLAGTAGASAQYTGYGTRNNSLYGGYGTGSNPNSNYVAPHINRNGSFTSGHYRTNPNNTTRDNYGTSGNYNPYTGTFGTRRPGW